MAGATDALGRLEAQVARLAAGEPAELEVVGWGDVSVVLGVGTEVAKRLPPMTTTAYARYRGVLDDYLAALTARGVTPAPCRLARIPSPLGGEATYLLQPRYPTILADLLDALSAAEATPWFETIGRHLAAVVDARVGLDAQAANWAVADGRLVYLDVTTPLLRDPTGRDRLDLEVFLASVPAVVRPAVRRFALPDILATYHDPHRVGVDVVADLLRRGLDRLVPHAVDALARTAVEVTLEEARRYLRRAERTWATLHRLRRLEAAWHRRVRRRPSPFLLPP
ncbi:MAG TPA: hypothetical protein ENK55_04380 [Actinobacteria bacterium]|nr:hypothetical protein [Actinomycetota bacterium]